MAGIGEIITQVGGAVGDLFGSGGASAEAKSYTGAATLAQQNAALTSASTRIQETQLARQITQTEGTQFADVGGAGFTEGGSALDLLRSSASQGALAKSLTNIQGAVNENAYAAQAGAYTAAAASAKETANAKQIAAYGSLGSTALSLGGDVLNYGADYLTGGVSGIVGDLIPGGFGGLVGDVGSVLGDVGGAIGSAVGSVICTAYYKQGFISKRTWMADSFYGLTVSNTIYQGYLIWAEPIANQIQNHKWLAYLLYPVFVPTVKQMAAEMGVGKSTIIGTISLKIFTFISWSVGCILKTSKGEVDAFAP